MGPCPRAASALASHHRKIPGLDKSPPWVAKGALPPVHVRQRGTFVPPVRTFSNMTSAYGAPEDSSGGMSSEGTARI